MEFKSQIIDNNITISLFFTDPQQCLKFTSDVAQIYGRMLIEGQTVTKPSPIVPATNDVIDKLTDIIEQQSKIITQLQTPLTADELGKKFIGQIFKEKQLTDTDADQSEDIIISANNEAEPAPVEFFKKKRNTNSWSEEQKAAARDRLAKRREDQPEKFTGYHKKQEDVLKENEPVLKTESLPSAQKKEITVTLEKNVLKTANPVPDHWRGKAKHPEDETVLKRPALIRDGDKVIPPITRESLEKSIS